MKLKIRYDNNFQVIDLDGESSERLWVSLRLTAYGLTESERERLIQKTWDDRFNRSDYNSWHKHNRHNVSFGITEAEKENEDDDRDLDEPTMDDVADKRIFMRDMLDREKREDYDDVCQWIRKTLKNKPHWSEAFIAVRMDGMSINDYAAKIGVSDASVVSQWLLRAKKKLKKNYKNRQI